MEDFSTTSAPLESSRVTVELVTTGLKDMETSEEAMVVVVEVVDTIEVAEVVAVADVTRTVMREHELEEGTRKITTTGATTDTTITSNPPTTIAENLGVVGSRLPHYRQLQQL